MKKNGEEFKNLVGSPSQRIRAKLGVPKKITGLGDVVEIVAKPVAKVSDAVFGTNLRNCEKCPERKEYLNKKFPI